MANTSFNVGITYTAESDYNEVTYYIAVTEFVLVTYNGSKFSKFTSKRTSRHVEENISVQDLCKLWGIKVSVLDAFMTSYFSPDEQALKEAKRRAKENISADEPAMSL